MAVTAVVVFITLHYVEAGYGVSYTRRWGPTVDNRLGWVLMEAPVFYYAIGFAFGGIPAGVSKQRRW